VTSVVITGPDPSQPGHVQTGQDYTITYKVANSSNGDTPDRQSQWFDWIFLSRDPILDSGDLFLGQLTHTGGLAAGQFYQVTKTFQATRDLSGPWYAFVLNDPPMPPSKPRGDVYEGNKEANNAASSATPLVFDVPPPSDLTVQTIALPSS